MNQKPSIGRIVHYQGPGTNAVDGPGAVPPKTYAAVVTEVHSDECVSLFVMTHIGHMNITSVVRADEPTAGCWNWPPRV